MAPKKPTANGRKASSRAGYEPPDETDTVFAVDANTGEPVRTKRKSGGEPDKPGASKTGEDATRYDEPAISDTVLEAGPESTEGWAAKAEGLEPPESFSTVFAVEGEQEASAVESVTHSGDGPSNVVYTPPRESGTLWEVRSSPPDASGGGGKPAGRNVVIVVVVVLIIAMVVAAIALDPLSLRRGNGLSGDGASNTSDSTQHDNDNDPNESEPIDAQGR